MRIETLAVVSGGETDPETGAIAPPIHLSTTFEHGPAGERRAGFEYVREANPTQQRLERMLADLEAGEAALAFASGQAAMYALLMGLPEGAHAIVPESCYTGLRILCEDFLPEKRIRAQAVDTTDVAAVSAAFCPETRLVWLETPSNPLLDVSDIATLAELAHARGALLACDNTFATPVLQQPLTLGADVVVHSTTKYFGGHSDVQGGALVFARQDELHAGAFHRRHITGGVGSPFNAWLILRGARSLPARMAWHCRNAMAVAQWLRGHPGVSAVHYPGLPDHPGHGLASRQMSGFGGMLSFRVGAGREAALRAAARLGIIRNATSLGGCETLIEHRASVEGPEPRSPQNLLRLSVGLEHAEDLIADLAQALE